MKIHEIHPGILRHRISIEKLTRDPDGYGGHIEVWGESGSVWSFVSPVSGSGRVKMQKEGYDISHKVFVRSGTDIEAGDRIIHRGRVLDVLVVVDLDEGRRFYEVLCLEKDRGVEEVQTDPEDPEDLEDPEDPEGV